MNEVTGYKFFSRSIIRSVAVWTYLKTPPEQFADVIRLFVCSDSDLSTICLACVASVSLRSSSRRLGQEQKKKPFFCFRSNFRAITRLETLATQATICSSFVSHIKKLPPAWTLLLKGSKQRCDIQTQTFIATEKYVNNIRSVEHKQRYQFYHRIFRKIYYRQTKLNILPYNLKSEHRIIC